MRAIAHVESGNNPAATNTNLYGSEDVGLMKINSWWLPRLKAYGITRDHLLDLCINISVGAWILRPEINQPGATWKAVGRYDSKTPSKGAAYAERVFRVWRRTQSVGSHGFLAGIGPNGRTGRTVRTDDLHSTDIFPTQVFYLMDEDEELAFKSKFTQGCRK